MQWCILLEELNILITAKYIWIDRYIDNGRITPHHAITLRIRSMFIVLDLESSKCKGTLLYTEKYCPHETRTHKALSHYTYSLVLPGINARCYGNLTWTCTVTVHLWLPDTDSYKSRITALDHHEHTQVWSHTTSHRSGMHKHRNITFREQSLLSPCHMELYILNALILYNKSH